MRKFLALCGAVLWFAIAAAAQDNFAQPATSSPANVAPSPPRYNSLEYPWQATASYEYIRFRPSSSGFSSRSTFSMHGFNSSLTRYLNDWFGLEGNMGAAFGHTADNQRAKFLWFGGGAHFSHRYRERWEPWAHVLVGGVHLFPQTGFPGNKGVGYIAGGGLDYRLSPRANWRVEGDFVGTRLYGQTQSSFQFVTGLVLNF